MPNHIHGIIVINDDNAETLRHDARYDVETLRRNVSTNTNTNTKNIFYSKISPKPQSLGAIIRSFKSICTKTVNKKFPNVNFQWQSRFYEHVVRDEKSLDRIRQYVINNPINWGTDKNNPNNL